MDDALAQIAQLGASTTNRGTRRKLAASLRRVADSLEEPLETMHRFASLVSSPSNTRKVVIFQTR